jgi:hypothetical protein
MCQSANPHLKQSILSALIAPDLPAGTRDLDSLGVALTVEASVGHSSSRRILLFIPFRLFH